MASVVKSLEDQAKYILKKYHNRPWPTRNHLLMLLEDLNCKELRQFRPKLTKISILFLLLCYFVKYIQTKDTKELLIFVDHVNKLLTLLLRNSFNAF